MHPEYDAWFNYHSIMSFNGLAPAKAGRIELRSSSNLIRDDGFNGVATSTAGCPCTVFAPRARGGQHLPAVTLFIQVVKDPADLRRRPAPVAARSIAPAPGSAPSVSSGHPAAQDTPKSFALQAPADTIHAHSRYR